MEDHGPRRQAELYGHGPQPYLKDEQHQPDVRRHPGAVGMRDAGWGMRGSRRVGRFRIPHLVSRIPSETPRDRKSTRLNSSHSSISYAVFCLKKKKTKKK